MHVMVITIVTRNFSLTTFARVTSVATVTIAAGSVERTGVIETVRIWQDIDDAAAALALTPVTRVRHALAVVAGVVVGAAAIVVVARLNDVAGAAIAAGVRRTGVKGHGAVLAGEAYGGSDVMVM